MNKTTSKTLIYSHIYCFEKYFDLRANIEWMSNNWITSIYLSFIYLILIFGGQQVMRCREPYHLRAPLFLWNLLLALFSIMGSLRLIPEVIDILNEKGFTASVCDNRFLTVQVSGVWLWLFIISKSFELIDTIFIILRKQRLIFLHWYHHITTLLFTWFAYSHQSSIGRWISFINIIVHSFMYSYYAIRTLKIRVPKVFAVLITSSQIIQMVFALFVVLYAINTKLNGYNCLTPYSVLYYGFLMCFSYLLLFLNFFINSYLKTSTEKREKIN